VLGKAKFFENFLGKLMEKSYDLQNTEFDSKKDL
jgi:hypothetical protein